MPLRAGAELCALYPTSRSIDDLREPFRGSVRRFVAELEARGCTVRIAATLRPPQRAWLMRQAWDVSSGRLAPSAVPVHPEIGPITWTVAGAREMVRTYSLAVRPSLTSRHIGGEAIDMRIEGWGTDEERIALGESFGVKKLRSDPPHWSSDGR